VALASEGLCVADAARYRLGVWPAARLLPSSGRSRDYCDLPLLFLFHVPPTPAIYTLSLHDALPIFLTSNKVWIATDRSRARRCVEACVYGTLDFVGYPRFPAPVEFIAAVIAYYVHPVNIQTACLIMEGAEFTENIINGVERP